MTPAFRAQLTRNHRTRDWLLFVPVPGNVSDWPSATWSTSTIPTIAQRTKALTELGYAYADGHEAWDWLETQDGERDQVQLSACADVRPKEEI